MLNAVASQIGQTERDNTGISPAVLGYLDAAGVAMRGDVCPPWGGALLAWAARQCSEPMPDAPGESASWIGWGAPLVRPQAGAVVVLTGGGRPGFLCGVAARVSGSKVYCIGAFDGVVQTRAFPIEQVIASRAPVGGASLQAPQQAVIAHQVIEPAEIVSPMPVLIEQQPPPPAFPAHALQAIIDALRNDLETVHARIDTVQNHAMAGVTLKELIDGR